VTLRNVRKVGKKQGEGVETAAKGANKEKGGKNLIYGGQLIRSINEKKKLQGDVTVAQGGDEEESLGQGGANTKSNNRASCDGGGGGGWGGGRNAKK